MADYVNVRQRDLLLTCTVTQQTCACDKKQSGLSSLANVEQIYMNVLQLILKRQKDQTVFVKRVFSCARGKNKFT